MDRLTVEWKLYLVSKQHHSWDSYTMFGMEDTPILGMGVRVGAVVVPSPCTTKVPGSIPVHDRASCAFGFSRSILALAGFLRELRFPPAFKIGE